MGQPAGAGERPDSEDLGPPPAPASAVEGVGGMVAVPPAPPGLPAFPVAPALPLDEEPPTPPVPAAPVDEMTPLPAEGEIVPLPPVDEVPLPGDMVPGDMVPADEIAPTAEVTFERMPCGPAPCAAPCATDCCWKTDDCGRPLDWCGKPMGFVDVTIEATGMDLEDPSGPIGQGRPNSLLWDAHDYDPEFGGRVTIGFVVSPKNRLEVRGGWSGIWRDASTQVGVFGFTPPAGGTSPVLTATMRSRAEMFGAEATWWRELCCRGSWRLLGGLGYRYISFDESATFTSVLPVGAVVVPGYAHARSEHDFHLGQVSLAVEKQLGRRFEVGLSGKGLLGSVSRDVNVQDANVLAGGIHASRNDSSDIAWGGEFELTLRYKLSARVALTAGYTLLYLDAVVRAHDGMDFTRAATGVVQARQETDSLLAQSVFAGLRVQL